MTCLIDEPEPTTLNQIDLQKYLNRKKGSDSPNVRVKLTDERVLNFIQANLCMKGKMTHREKGFSVKIYNCSLFILSQKYLKNLHN